MEVFVRKLGVERVLDKISTGATKGKYTVGRVAGSRYAILKLSQGYPWQAEYQRAEARLEVLQLT
jgi:hypothetical protein